MEKTTCQICEREIKSSTGVIAHHGYQRPNLGSGWQTASCWGARHLPYEQSCNAIQPCIDHITQYVQDQKRMAKELMENPPETLAESYTSFYRKQTVYVRPEGFNEARAIENLESGYGRGYEYEHRARVCMHQREAENGSNDIKRLAKRLADWKSSKTLSSV